MTSHPKEPKLPESLEDTLRLLSASMRHSAGQWMVPGWDGHKVADVLQKAESALKARDAEIERLRGVLVETRRVLEQENNKGDASAIRDTIWRGPAETLFDYLDAAIDQARATGGEKANG